MSARTDVALLEELADTLEVITALGQQYGYSIDDVNRVAEAKRKKKGGFNDGMLLVETGCESPSAPSRMAQPRSRARVTEFGAIVDVSRIPPSVGNVEIVKWISSDNEFEMKIVHLSSEVRLFLRRASKVQDSQSQLVLFDENGG